MPDPAPHIPHAACWLLPDQTEEIARCMERAGITVQAAGCPEPAQTATVARALECEPTDDLRALLSRGEHDLILIAAPVEFGDRDPAPDLDAIQAASSKQTIVATLEPIPANPTHVAGSDWIDALASGTFAEMVRFAPRTRQSRPIAELHTMFETFGPPRSCSLRSIGPAALGSLGARLFDAMDLTRTILGVPELIDAAFVGPASARGLHALPGSSLRLLSGDIACNMRFPDGRAMTLHLSDQASRSEADLGLLGSEGSITVHADSLTWTHPDGTTETTTIRSAFENSGDADPGELALARQLADLCAGVTQGIAPIDYPSVLAMTHASLLSARTGQGESPETVLRLLSIE